MIATGLRSWGTPGSKTRIALISAPVLLATALFVAVADSHPDLLALAAGALLVTAIALREPRLVVPVIILALPLDISKLLSPCPPPPPPPRAPPAARRPPAPRASVSPS